MAGEMVIAAIPNILDGGSSMIGQGTGVGVAGGSHNDQEPSSYSLATDALPNYATFQTKASRDESVGYVAIVGHNLDRARGSYWRALTLNSATAPADTSTYLQLLYPTALEASSAGLNGTFSSVDDSPFASSVDFIGDNFDWHARFSFATPSSAPTTTADGQAFVLRFGPVASALSARATVKLYEGGVEKATLLDNVALCGTDGDTLNRIVVVLPWSASLLSSADGSGVEIRIDGTSDIVCYSVLWVACFDPGNGAVDSGWIALSDPATPASFGGTSPHVAGLQPQQTEYYALPATFDSMGGAYRPLVVVSMLSGANDDRLPRLGVLAAGTAWSPPEGKNFTALSLQVNDLSKKTSTLGGQQLPSARNRQRIMTFTLPRLTRSEAQQLVTRIDWNKGTVGAFLVVLYPDDPTLKPLTTLWCTLDEGAPSPLVLSPVTVGGTSEDTVPFRFDKTYTVKEKL